MYITWTHTWFLSLVGYNLLTIVMHFDACVRILLVSPITIRTPSCLPTQEVSGPSCIFPAPAWNLPFLLFFFNMKFIVKLVSIQHPALIPTGALLNAHQPLSPPCHPSTLSLFSVFKSLLWFASLSLTFFPLPLLHGLLLSFSGST